MLKNGTFAVQGDDVRYCRQCKKHCKSEFYKDEYIDTIKLPNVKSGDLTLAYATYAKDEIFQYDMPLVDPPALRLGYFDEDVSFPAIYEGNMPWVSACPSEINSMSGSLSEVSGKVLVLGLGLGYYPFIASQKSNVREITIVEINSGIIDIFTRYVLPQFPMKQKIKIVCADAIKYMASVKKANTIIVLRTFGRAQRTVPTGISL